MEMVVRTRVMLPQASITILLPDASAKKIPFWWNGSVRVNAVRQCRQRHPGVNTTCCVVYRPPIAVSLSLRVMSVSYFK
jgi:hypothetical protein